MEFVLVYCYFVKNLEKWDLLVCVFNICNYVKWCNNIIVVLRYVFIVNIIIIKYWFLKIKINDF